MNNFYTTKPKTDVTIKELTESIETTICKTNTWIKIVQGEGWSFQYGGRLPFRIQPCEEVYVPNGVTYKLIKGKTKVVIEVRED
jgi:hypothetical protein